MKIFNNILFLGLLIISGYRSFLVGQEMPIQFDNIGIERGLVNSTVYDIIQDKKGYLWIATQNGLNKFDGYTFTAFKTIPFDTLSLTNNWIQAIHESSDGKIWIGTLNGGVSRLDPKTRIFTNYKNDSADNTTINNNRVWKIFEDNKNHIWIGISGGLDKFNRETNVFEHFLTKELNSIPNGAVNSITQDNDGFIWVATWGAGLFKLDSDGNILKQYLFSNNVKLTSNKLKVVYLGSDNYLWIGTNQDGLIKFDKNSEQYSFFTKSVNDPYSLSHNSVLSIIEDKNHNFWVGTHSGGLNLFDRAKEKFIKYQNDPYDNYSISNNWVSTIFQSKSGIMWIGTDKGICKFVSGNQVFYNLQHKNSDPNSLTSDDVHAVLEDNKGLMWIGTWRNGLNIYNPTTKRIKKYFNDPKNKFSLPNNTVFAIYEDKQNNIWIGSYNGLAKYIPESDNFKVYRNNPNDPESIGFNNITSICQDSYGFLWIGTWDGGLQKMNMKTEKFKRYQKNMNSENGLNDMVINCIYEDKNKNLLVGTSSGGLNIYNREQDKFASFLNSPKDSNSLSNNCISSIVESTNGTIWIGTLGGGLNKFNSSTNTFEHYYSLTGLSDNSIMSLQPDSDNNIWLTTSNNISFFNTYNNSIISFDTKDGISNTQFTNTSARGKDGKFIFAGKNGVTYFYPSRTLEPILKPNIEIISVKVYGLNVEIRLDEDQNEFIELDHSENELTIDFAALDYYRPDKIKYGYMLEGFHDDWEFSNNFRTAYFTNLDPGKYKFKLIASFENNNWYDRDKYLSIVILPPFWERWWFILMSFITFIAIIYFAYWYRMNQLLKMERLRTSIAADLHDDIASNLSGIAMFGKIIQDENQKANSAETPSDQLLDRIITLSQESVDSIREIIWAIDTRPETIYDLLIKVNDLIIISCHAKNIKFNFDIPSRELLPVKNLLPNERRDLWMLLKEALNNSIKHSECDQLYLITTYDGDLVRIVIRDNGKGFNINNRYSGRGISTITKRADSLRATLEISSEIGGGTSIILSFKI